jgi:ribonuclease HI
LDSQTAIQRTLNDKLGLGQALAIEIIATIEELKEKGVQTTIRWVPSHFSIKDNEKADLLAKKAVNQLKSVLIYSYSSFSYIQRLV